MGLAGLTMLADEEVELATIAAGINTHHDDDDGGPKKERDLMRSTEI